MPLSVARLETALLAGSFGSMAARAAATAQAKAFLHRVMRFATWSVWGIGFKAWHRSSLNRWLDPLSGLLTAHRVARARPRSPRSTCTIASCWLVLMWRIVRIMLWRWVYSPSNRVRSLADTDVHRAVNIHQPLFAMSGVR
jgi:hypothetical protein